MTAPTTDATWRDDLQRSFEKLTNAFENELSQARRAAAADAARVNSETLNQAIRRLRQTKGEPSLLSVLVETSAPFSERAAAIVLEGTRARVLGTRGFTAPEIGFDVNTAAALMSAIETKDPVAASCNDAELSPELCGAALDGFERIERCYIFPIVSAGSVRAVLFAMGEVRAAALELLSETAAMRLDALYASFRPVSRPAAWTDLPPADQVLHLKAQRFARVVVAEMRLARPDAVREGQQRADLYMALQQEIDWARDTYRKEYMTATPTMVDYLYIELVRSLANDDDHLLGTGFPGRLI